MESNTTSTCPKETATDPPSLFQNGNIVFQAHHVGWIVCGGFTLIATIASAWLINKHLTWYTNKREQRYIVRLLFMVPIYAIISFASYLFWNHSTPLLLLRDAYEAIVLTAFFYLLLMYLSHDPEEQKRIFVKFGLSEEAAAIARENGQDAGKWVFPFGFVKWKPADGLFFLQLMKWGVLQYCVIRPITTLAAIILEYAGLYCEESWGLGWGHIYITIIISLSVTIAMYCLIQLYVSVAKLLAPQKPLLKLFAIKAVVFLTFWQATFLSVLSMFDVVKDTKFMTAADINIGIGALLETFEMTLFAFLHVRAFAYKPYKPIDQKYELSNHTPRLRSFGHAMDFRETFRELWVGCVYMFDKIRGREPTPDLSTKRTIHYEGAFGRSRNFEVGKVLLQGSSNKHYKHPTVQVEVHEDIEIDVASERRRLGTGDNSGNGFGYLTREKSEGLEIQIERELERRGYTARTNNSTLHIEPWTEGSQGHERQQSWWRNIYHRRHVDDRVNLHVDFTKRGRHSRYSRQPMSPEGVQQMLPEAIIYDDLPPQSILRTNEHELLARGRIRNDQYSLFVPDDEADVLARLHGTLLHRYDPSLVNTDINADQRSRNLKHLAVSEIENIFPDTSPNLSKAPRDGHTQMAGKHHGHVNVRGVARSSLSISIDDYRHLQAGAWLMSSNQNTWVQDDVEDDRHCIADDINQPIPSIPASAVPGSGRYLSSIGAPTFVPTLDDMPMKEIPGQFSPRQDVRPHSRYESYSKAFGRFDRTKGFIERSSLLPSLADCGLNLIPPKTNALSPYTKQSQHTSLQPC